MENARQNEQQEKKTVVLKVWDYSEDVGYEVRFAEGVDLKVFVDLFGEERGFKGLTFAFDREDEKIKFGDEVKKSYSPVFVLGQGGTVGQKGPQRFVFIVDEEVWGSKRKDILKALEMNMEKQFDSSKKGLIAILIDVIRNEMVFVWTGQKNRKWYLYSKHVPFSCVDRAKDLKVYLGDLVKPYPEE